MQRSRGGLQAKLVSNAKGWWAPSGSLIIQKWFYRDLTLTHPTTGVLAGPGAAVVGAASRAAAGANLTGTVTGTITEADIVAGGKTIIVTLDGDTFIAN